MNPRDDGEKLNGSRKEEEVELLSLKMSIHARILHKKKLGKRLITATRKINATQVLTEQK